jgi:uncharacterized Zn finger protein (UPF0148 family)
MRVPKGYTGAWTRCNVCGRVLWVEDGPTCPGCKPLVKQEPARDDKPEPQPAPRKRSGG